MVGADLYVELDRLTPEQYAQLNRVTKQTVRRWCRLGLLDCFEDERGLLISRHAKRKMPEPES
jgi:predicted site-specific integrase-resolvase